MGGSATMMNEVIPSSGNVAVSCDCRLLTPAPGQVHDLLQAWLADHPRHTRQQHIFAYDLLKWLERRSNGGRE
jgi:hypothetical protein